MGTLGAARSASGPIRAHGLALLRCFRAAGGELLTFAPRTALSAMLVSDAGAITGGFSRGDFVIPQRCLGAGEALAAPCPRFSGTREGAQKGDVVFDGAPNVPRWFQQGPAPGEAPTAPAPTVMQREEHDPPPPSPMTP